jgi:tetratricopeptide (TPR) repeat protein
MPALEQVPRWPAADGEVPWLAVAERLAEGGALKLALEWLGHAPETDDALILRCAIETDLSPGSQRSTLERLWARKPSNEAVAVRLAELLLEADDHEAAATVLESFASSSLPRTVRALGHAFAGAGRTDEAIEVLRPFIESAERAQDPVLLGSPDFQELSRLLGELVAHQFGAEAATVDLMRRGQLDARSGRNHRSLAKSLMLKSPARGPRLSLASVEELDALAHSLHATDQGTAAVQAGVAALRREKLSLARRHFEEAREADPSHFGAALGLGVARDVEQRSLFALARKLREEAVPPALQKVVPDWPALTPLERRIVVVSTWPVRALLPDLAKKGAVIKVLPLDVRPTDLPELADIAGLRAEDDHRSWDALEGLAGERLAVVKVEELLDTTHEGLTFAHELAHLAELVLPRKARARLDALYANALTTEFVFDQYALRNVHEFFAVHATFALLRRLGREVPVVPDEAGHLEAVLRWFDELGDGPRAPR